MDDKRREGFYYIFTVPGQPRGYTTRNYNSRPSKQYLRCVEFMKNVRKCAREAGVPLPLNASEEYPIIIKTVAYFKNRNHCDPENVRKAVGDALFYDEVNKRKGNDKHVAGAYETGRYSSERPRTLVIISSMIKINKLYKGLYRSIKGKKFGKLKIIYPIGHTKRQKVIWHVKCSCGTRKNIVISNIIHGKTKSCGCINASLYSEEFIGKRFNKLKVINIKRGEVMTMWECICDCGNSYIGRASVILKGRTRSCGCMRGPKKVDDETWVLRRVYSSYKQGARIRGIKFSVKESDFRKLIFLNCFYCGSAPRNVKCGKVKSMYNGIDRLDNKVGYLEKNCVACCKICNFAKHTLSYNEFISYLDRLVAYRSKASRVGNCRLRTSN